MKMFGIRQGVEFFPAQDNFGNQRKDFIDRVIKYNQLDTRLDSIWDNCLCDGQGLFYIRPTQANYRLYFFRKHEYRTYYNIDGELDEVVIIYSYRVRSGLGYMQDVNQGSLTGPATLGGQGARRFIKLSIKRKTIEETHSEGELSFDQPYSVASGQTKTFKNTLGFIPCVEIFNNPKGFSTEGVGEFDSLANHIVTHDELVRTMRKNIQFFGSPTLLSSRPKTDLIEAGGDSVVQRPSIAANSGFTSQAALSRSTFKSDPVSRGVDGQIRVPRIIANLEPNDRVGYIVPDAITGDQNSFSRQYREEIRTALGGVDELSISAGVTATEYKSLFGRVSATAKKKANAIYTYGISRCLELIIYQEERLFRETLAAAAGLEKPVEPKEDAPQEELNMYADALAGFDERVKGLMMACVKTQQVPPGVLGLIPDGDLSVQWRWLGPVYEDSTQDILNNSIVVRNLQELGVDSIEALKYLFPSKTDEERAEMLSGFPFRMVGELQNAYSSFSRLVGGMMQTPHPQSPDLPMAADPRLDLTPYLYRTLEALQKEMSYAGRYRPIDPTDEPSTVSSSKQLRGTGSVGSGAQLPSSSGSVSSGYELPPGGTSGSPQLPISPYSVRPPIPTSGPIAELLGGQSLGVGVQQGSEPAERTSPIPVPGQPSAPTPQYAPANYGQVSSPATQQSAPQTWQANPAYSPSSSQTSSSPSLEEIADYVGMSQESRQVVDAFGIEAPAVLNNYALNLEGMLDSAVAWGNQAANTIQGYAQFSVNEHQENLAYNEILTNPDVLSDYTLKFFGPEGPYPVYENEQQLETPGYRTQPVSYEQGQFPAPPSAAAMQQPENFWGSFKEMMDRDPQNAWRVINQAQPQVLANKLFVME
jgi:hypothetical protein